jgi:hypothetical protein
MNRALEGRLCKLEAARGDPRQAMTDEELEARVRELMRDLGGPEAILASLDDSCDWHRDLRRRLREYQRTGRFV